MIGTKGYLSASSGQMLVSASKKESMSTTEKQSIMTSGFGLKQGRMGTQGGGLAFSLSSSKALALAPLEALELAADKTCLVWAESACW